MSDVVTADKTRIKTPAESILFGFDFTKLLNADEILSSSPTVVDAASVLTIASVAINTSTFKTDEGKTVLISKGVQARISGGVDGATYTLTAQATTNQSNVRELVCSLKLDDGVA